MAKKYKITATATPWGASHTNQTGDDMNKLLRSLNNKYVILADDRDAKKTITPQAIRKIYKNYIQLKNDCNDSADEWKGLTVKIPSLEEIIENSEELRDYSKDSIKALLKSANLRFLDHEEVYQDKKGIEYVTNRKGKGAIKR